MTFFGQAVYIWLKTIVLIQLVNLIFKNLIHLCVTNWNNSIGPTILFFSVVCNARWNEYSYLGYLSVMWTYAWTDLNKCIFQVGHWLVDTCDALSGQHAVYWVSPSDSNYRATFPRLPLIGTQGSVLLACWNKPRGLSARFQSITHWETDLDINSIIL